MRIQDVARAIIGLVTEIKYELLIASQSMVAIIIGLIVILLYVPALVAIVIVTAVIALCKTLIGSK